jgi:outer membrane lipoprotein carrier protein
MRIYLKLGLYLTILMTFIFPRAFAADSAAELTGLLGAIKTMRASFIQTIFDNYGKPVQKSKGTMALERPGKFRWEVSQPMPQTIIANSQKLWVYDPDLQQVTIRNLKSEAGEAPALLLSHQNSDLQKDYSIEVITSKDSLQWFLLKPKKNDNMFESVKMAFANKQLKEMVLQDQIGHSTRVQFQKIQMNSALPASLFIFKAPSGTDVIDESH